MKSLSCTRALAFAGVLMALAGCARSPSAEAASTASLFQGFDPAQDCRNDLGQPTRIVNGASRPNKQWEADNLVMVALPWQAHAAWNAHLAIKGLQVHRRVAVSLQRALADIWTDAGKSQSEIDRVGMSSIGGAFNWRPVRGAGDMSAHAYGCAVDFDPARNVLGSQASNFAEPGNRYVIDDFRKEGWIWGGIWPRPDGMHFQATSVAISDETTGANRRA